MQNLLPGVPLVHSPFFEEILQTSGWDDETRRVALELNQEGFSVIDFDEPDLDSLIDDIDKQIFSPLPWDRWRSGQLHELRVAEAWQENDSVRRIAGNAHVRALLSKIYGREAFPFQTLNFAVGSQQPAHNDLVHFASMPEQFMCGVWLALEDIEEGSGPLVYYPGSHRWPILLNEHVGRPPAPADSPYEQHELFEAVWAKLRETQGAQPKLFYPRKGQALIWVANLHHGGWPQTDKSKTRYSQVTHYMFRGCSYWTPLISNPFVGRIGFRSDILDVGSGERISHEVAGIPVPDEFMRMAMQHNHEPSPPSRSATERLEPSGGPPRLGEKPPSRRRRSILERFLNRRTS